MIASGIGDTSWIHRTGSTAYPRDGGDHPGRGLGSRLMQKCLSLLALSTALMACATLAAGGTGTEKAEASPAAAGRRVDFERDIRPIFAEHCTKCHGDKRQRGGYRLDGRADAIRGGDSGEAAIVPGQGSESRLIRLVAGLEPDLTMPPKGPRLDAQSSRPPARVDRPGGRMAGGPGRGRAEDPLVPHSPGAAAGAGGRRHRTGPAAPSMPSCGRSSPRRGSSPRPRPTAGRSSAASRST